MHAQAENVLVDVDERGHAQHGEQHVACLHHCKPGLAVQLGELGLRNRRARVELKAGE